MTAMTVEPATIRPPAARKTLPTMIYRSWKTRLINGGLRLLDRLGWLKVRVVVDHLIRDAQAETGLQFQDRRFEEPLRILERSLNEEADLHPLGKILLLISIKGFLKNRLWLEEVFRRQPELAQTPVRRPLYVIGLPRTGTTLLYNLLCQDPRGRPLLGWESLFPVAPQPVPGKLVRDDRRETAIKIIRRLHRMAPHLKAVHEIVAEGPEECTWLLHNTMLSPAFMLQARIPAYERYLRALPREAWRGAYTEYANMLRVLQQNSPGEHWVLKSPAHQLGLSGLLDVLPEACVVQTHRNVGKVIGSCCSLFSVVRGIYSDQVRPAELGPEVLGNLQLAAERAMTARDEHPQQVFDVRFEELVADPLGTVRRIYDRFGFSFDPRMEAGMQQWLAANPQGKHGTHKYDLAQFGLTDADVTSRFAAYQSRFEAATRTEES